MGQVGVGRVQDLARGGVVGLADLLGLKHPDHLVGLAIQAEAPADERRVGAKAARLHIDTTGTYF